MLMFDSFRYVWLPSRQRQTEAIGINRVTIGAWTDNAPIGKLVKLSKFTGIPLMDVINCLVIEDDSGANSLIREQQHEQV
jgi:hypothetical protein